MAVDQIGTKGLVDCSVAAADIAPGTITSAKLAGSIANSKLSNNSITVNGTSINLGASGAVPPVQWQSVVVSDGSTITTMVAGRGYFVNNTSAAGIVKLPASASAGDIVQIKDYAGNFGTNNLTIQRNSHKIQGNAIDSKIDTDRASLTLVYVDATKGWLYANESNVSNFGLLYNEATGGTVTTSGDFKIHSFTGDGNFVVSQVGNDAGGLAKVSYTVVAGGGGGAGLRGGGGGAGGFREGRASNDSFGVSPLNAPDGLTVSVQTYPITVGAGGSAGAGGADGSAGHGTNGANSVFSTITSAGGGLGSTSDGPAPARTPGGPGGSGGGGSYNAGAGGTGNNPPVSPPQGNNGGNGVNAGNAYGGGGGGGASASGTTGRPTSNAGGGGGVSNSITGSPVARAGGGGGAHSSGPAYPGNPTGAGAGGSGGGGAGGPAPGSTSAGGTAGTANTGGGGGGGSFYGGGPYFGNAGGAGGSGIVLIRYKYQN